MKILTIGAILAVITLAITINSRRSIVISDRGELVSEYQPTIPPENRTAVMFADKPSRIHVKFTKSSGVRLRVGKLRAPANVNIGQINEVIQQFPEAKIERLLSLPESVLDRKRERIETKTGQNVPI